MRVTSLPTEVPADDVLEAYRLRPRASADARTCGGWQVELAFRRLESLLGLGRLPVKNETLAAVGGWPISSWRC